MRVLRTALVAVCVSAAAISVPSATGSAAPAGPSPSGADAGPAITPVVGTSPVWDPATGTTRLLAGGDAQRAIEAYWTPERMKSATPATLSAATAADDARAKARAAAPAPMRIDPPMTAQQPAGPGTQDAAFSFTTGRIMFVENGLNKWCSGSAATGTNRRLILTAAHCVHGGPGGTYHPNWVFVPGYQNGSVPRGTFTAYHVWFWSPWSSSGDRHYDYAFVVAWNNEFGQRVVDAVGGHGLVSNAGRPFVHVAGYPGNRDAGQVQWYCWGTTDRRSLFNSDQELGCAWAGGSSGGPWLRDYDHANGLGLAISVTSYTTNSSGVGPPIYGPYFDGDMFTLRNTANADLPPA